MQRLPRFIAALVLVVLYTLIIVSPLAPLALRSTTIAHALTGECASDCAICGCSPERSANRSCCCWQKKRLHDHEADKEEPACCRKKQAAKNAPAMISARPCGSSKILALSGVEQSELLPSFFSPGIPVSSEALLPAPISACRADWPGEPPDPPPELSDVS